MAPAAEAEDDPCLYKCSGKVVAADQRFKGTATLYVPGRGRINGSTSSSGELCPECEWGLVIACVGNGAPGSGGQDNSCAGASLRCRAIGGQLFTLYFRPDPAADWREVDYVCIGAGEDPVTPAQIAAALREPFEKLVPPQKPGFQPGGGALVHLPTIFYAGQPTRTSGTVQVLGFDITISAEPTWTWRFEPGQSRSFTVPGAPYPNKDVTYTYTTTGPRSVVLTTRWKGKYVVEGDGPYDIAAPVTQNSAALQVPVYEARGQLVGGQRG